MLKERRFDRNTPIRNKKEETTYMGMVEKK
jgi:hypothetical protein